MFIIEKYQCKALRLKHLKISVVQNKIVELQIFLLINKVI